jgi:hypothetical protein
MPIPAPTYAIVRRLTAPRSPWLERGGRLDVRFFAHAGPEGARDHRYDLRLGMLMWGDVKAIGQAKAKSLLVPGSP